MAKLKLHFEEGSDREEPLIYADDLRNYLHEEIKRYERWQHNNPAAHYMSNIAALTDVMIDIAKAIESLTWRGNDE